MRKRLQSRSTRSFRHQHFHEFSDLPEMSRNDIASYRLDEVLPEITKETRILDVGVGTCRLTKVLIEKNPKSITAIDPAISYEEFLRFLKLRDVSQKDVDVDFAQVEVEQFVYKGLKFDLICILGVLHHIPQASASLLHLTNSLNKNGYIVLWLYSKNIGIVSLNLLKLGRAVFRFLGPFKFYMTHLVLSFLKIRAKVSFDVATRDLVKKNKSEALLAIYDQLNAGYAKYYDENSIKKLADSANLHIETLLRTGNKGFTVLLKPKVFL